MKLLAVIFILILLGANLWWMISVVDDGYAYTDLEVSYEYEKQALDQTLALVPRIVAGTDSRSEIVDLFANEFGMADGFEKDGFFWIGRIGIQFGANGEVVEIRRSFDLDPALNSEED